MGGSEPVAERREIGEGTGETLQVVGPDPSGDAVENDQQADHHDHHGKARVVSEGPDQHPFNQDAQSERGSQCQQERPPEGNARLDQGQRDERREHGHLALREVDQVRRLVDHHQRQSDAGVDPAHREAGKNLVQKRVHVYDPR
jgi:hypothetical protein